MHSHFIEHIFAISERYRVTIRAAIDANELGIGAMHVRSLTVIAETQDCTANHIVTTLSRDKAQVARLVKELLAAGLIEKNAHPEDKRSQILTLSSSGNTLMKQLKAAKATIQLQMTQGLSTHELDLFNAIAHKIADNLVCNNTL